MATNLSEATLLRFGVFELDLEKRKLRRNGILIDIQPQAFRVLTLLASRPNDVVTREQIRNELWPKEPFGDLDSRLNFEIKKIREALGDDADRPRYVETVRKSGYKFIASTEGVAARLSDLGERVGDGETLKGSAPGSPSSEEPGHRMDGEQAESARRIATPRRVTTGLVIVISIISIVVLLSSRRGRGVHQASTQETADLNSQVNAGVPVIASVTPILPRQTQTIVIKGRGFGTYTKFDKLDTPFLAIRNKSAHWAAGRIISENADDVTLSVANWTDSEIIVSGFAGEYGQDTWQLHPYDRIEIAVWNPQTGVGPARYHLAVDADPLQ